MEKNDYLDSMFDGFKEIRDISSELNRMSKAFYITGNEIVADSLNAIGNDLYDIQEKLNSAVSRELNVQLAKSKQGVTDTLKAALSLSSREE